MAFQLGIFIAAAAPLMVALGNRLKLWVRMLFLLLWGTLVYAPIAYWIWGGGWHSATLDYAGGIVVQATVGFSALALALGLGRLPAGAPPRPQAPALPLLGAGTMLFWAGALVCNASHALAATAGSANACIATHLAACTGILGWAGWEWLVRGTASPTGICAGAVTGLFAIAPACGFVAPQSALLIGLTAGVVGQVAFQTVAARRDDHPLIVLFVLQGIAGVIGVMLTGVFATPGIAGFNRRGDEISGALSGNFEQLGVQAAALGAAVALAFVGTALIAGVIRVIARPAAQNGHSAASA